MAVNLTQGAIDMICSGDTEIKPYLQVTEVRLVSATNQTSTNERYRMLVSDGTHTQQAMLATQRNDLVKSGRLQKGSIVKLLQFVCNLIQNRKIIIIIELEVVKEQCDLLGQPASLMPGAAKSAQVQSSADQAPSLNGNLQYGNAQSASVPNPNLTGMSSLQAPQLERRPEVQPYGSPYANNSGTGRFAPTNPPPMYARPGFGSENSVASNVAGGYNNSMTGASHYTPNVRPAHQQPPPVYMNRGPIAKNEAAPRIVPIAALNPYQGRWTIKARVTAKSDLRRYSNARGEGKVFNFDLLDSDKGEIRVICFNAVVDQFFSLIEVGRVYLISKGTLKPAQKAYNHLPNDYEISLDSTSSVQPCFDDDTSIPTQQFRFRPISDLEGMEKNNVVDIIGIVSSISPSTTIIKKDSTETQKRSLQLRDMSGKSVEVTLWGDFCNTQGQELQSICDSGHFPVLAVKSGRVNEFNGKTVGTVSSTVLFIEPDLPEARTLNEWFKREGKNTPSILISREGSGFSRTEVRKTISQIKDEKLGTTEKPDYILVCAHISFIKIDNFCYTACPLISGERKCAKKVTNNGDGKWHCDKCDQVVDECEYRYMLQFQIQDHTGLTWVTSFQECAEQIMCVSAKELYSLKFEEQDDEKFNEYICRVLFSKHLFKLKVKEETFSDEQKIKSTLMKVDPVDFSSEMRFLVGLMTNQTPEPSNPPLNAGVQPTNSTTNYVGIGTTGVASNPASGYGTQYGDPRYSTGNNISGTPYASCSSCGGFGHSPANCPSVMSGPNGYTSRTPPSQTPAPAYSTGGASGSECFKCHQTGHWARDCPGSSALPQSSGPVSGGGGSGECYKCHQTGHWARDCPGVGAVNQSGSAGSGASGGQCYKCHQYGHWSRDCPGTPAYGMQKQHIGGGY
ncbi:hypothetical protein V2J09_003077 [Rumex salicifolius]